MTQRNGALISRVQTIAFDRPQQMREQIVLAMRDAVPSNLGMFLKCTTDAAGERYFTGVILNGDHDIVERLRPFIDAPALDCPWLPPHTDPSVIDNFIRIRSHYDYAYQTSFETERRIWSTLETGDQVRAVLCDGVRLLGWIGLVRRGRDQRFSQHEERTLQSALGVIKAALAAIEALESEDIEEGLAAVYRADGKIEHASPPFRRWLDPTRSAGLCRWVRDVDRGSERGGTQITGGAETRIVRLEGLAGVRYLVTVDRAELLRIGPEYRLTERQREVAELAAVGATNVQIASTMAISPNTVKMHLKNIYERLGVGSRMELSQALR